MVVVVSRDIDEDIDISNGDTNDDNNHGFVIAKPMKKE